MRAELAEHPEVADRFVLRMPMKLKQDIAEAAEKKGRSINAEIVTRLEESLQNDGEMDAIAMVTLDYVSATSDHVQNLAKQVSELLRRVPKLKKR